MDYFRRLMRLTNPDFSQPRINRNQDTVKGNKKPAASHDKDVSPLHQEETIVIDSKSPISRQESSLNNIETNRDFPGPSEIIRQDTNMEAEINSSKKDITSITSQRQDSSASNHIPKQFQRKADLFDDPVGFGKKERGDSFLEKRQRLEHSPGNSQSGRLDQNGIIEEVPKQSVLNNVTKAEIKDKSPEDNNIEKGRTEIKKDRYGDNTITKVLNVEKMKETEKIYKDNIQEFSHRNMMQDKVSLSKEANLKEIKAKDSLSKEQTYQMSIGSINVIVEGPEANKNERPAADIVKQNKPADEQTFFRWQRHYMRLR